MRVTRNILSRAFWAVSGIFVGFLLSLVANYPGNAVDRMWADFFDCEQRFIAIARATVEYNTKGPFEIERLSLFSDDLATYSNVCGRVGSFDLHQAVSSVDRRLSGDDPTKSGELANRLCFGEMISLMKADPASWPEYFRSYEKNLNFCEQRQKPAFSWLGALVSP